MAYWDKKLAIILPTYNESKNLRKLLLYITSVVPQATIYIVDDSNDRENKKIQQIVKHFSNVSVMTRQKKLGRGSAILTGFTQALEKKKYQYFIEMDTDLAHDPREIPVLFQKMIETNAQLVIGSRYVSGSKIIKWPLRRLVMSKIINVFLRLLYGVRLHDFTNGFRLYTRKAVVALVKKGLQEKNFIALSESVLVLSSRKYAIVEVPITFTDRQKGKSTVGIKELCLCLLSAFRVKVRYSPIKDMHLLLFLFFFTFLIRLPLYGTDFWRTPDAIEYINVANEINAGHGFTQTIKWHFFTESPVVTSAFEGKPFLASLIFAPVLSLFNDVYSLQLFLFIVMAFVVVVFYRICRQFMPQLFAFLLALLVSLNPNLFINSRLVLSEPLFYLFVLCALFFFFKAKKNAFHYCLIGFFAGLSYMTRNEGLLLLFAFILFSLKQRKQLLVITAAFLLTTSPYLFGNYLVNGSPFYSYNIHHFRVHQFLEGMATGYGKVFPSAIAFVSNNVFWIIERFFQLMWGNILWLIGLSYFGLLSVFYLFFIKRELWKYFGVCLLFAFLIVVNYSIFWSAFLAADRYLGLVFMLVLIPIGYAVSMVKHTKKIVAVSMILLMLGVYVAYDIHRINWARTVDSFSEIWRVSLKHDMYAFLNTQTEKDIIIASPNPHMIYLYTNRSSVLLPNTFSSEEQLKKFMHEYNVDYVITEKDFPFAIDLKKSYLSGNIAIYENK